MEKLRKGIVVCALFGLIFLGGCSSENKQSNLLFRNDLESYEGWVKVNSLTKGQGNSGNHCLRVDSVFEFCDGFNIKLKDVSDKPIKKIKFSAYCLLTSKDSKATLVLTLDSTNKPNISWTGIALETVIKETGKWVKVSGEVDLTGPGLNKPSNTVILYLWNNNKSKTLVDDFEIEFEE